MLIGWLLVAFEKCCRSQALQYDDADITLSKPEELGFSLLGTECSRIEGAENRGISIEQLLRLYEFLESHSNGGGWLNGWTDRAPREYSATSGLRLNSKSINLYQVSFCDLSTIECRVVLPVERLGDLAEYQIIHM